jgi:membrane protease YdiL (CAAX protease family)
MSFFVAALWSIAALFAFILTYGLLLAASPGAMHDPMSGVLCQAVGFLGVLYLMLLVHEPGQPLSQVLGFRRTSVWLLLLAVLLGVALQPPLDLIAGFIEKLFPLSEEARRDMEQFLDVSTLQRKIVLFVAAGLVGPVIEEVFFRGGILRSLRRVHSAGLTLVGVSLLFAGAHHDLRDALPDFLGGLAMGYVRIMSGSIWPAILVHVAFNSSAVMLQIRYGPEGTPWNALGLAVCLGAILSLILGFRAIAVRSERSTQAREQDLA